MTLTDIGLSAATMKAVEKKARGLGKSGAEYVRLLVESDLLADQSFDEILRPIREDVRKSGITESQVEDIVRRARKAVAKGTKPSSRTRR